MARSTLGTEENIAISDNLRKAVAGLGMNALFLAERVRAEYALREEGDADADTLKDLGDCCEQIVAVVRPITDIRKCKICGHQIWGSGRLFCPSCREDLTNADAAVKEEHEDDKTQGQ